MKKSFLTLTIIFLSQNIFAGPNTDCMRGVNKTKEFLTTATRVKLPAYKFQEAITLCDENSQDRKNNVRAYKAFYPKLRDNQLNCIFGGKTILNNDDWGIRRDLASMYEMEINRICKK